GPTLNLVLLLSSWRSRRPGGSSVLPPLVPVTAGAFYGVFPGLPPRPAGTTAASPAQGDCTDAPGTAGVAVRPVAVRRVRRRQEAAGGLQVAVQRQGPGRLDADRQEGGVGRRRGRRRPLRQRRGRRLAADGQGVRRLRTAAGIQDAEERQQRRRPADA